MIEFNRGYLVSISLVLGLFGMRGVSDYCSLKFVISGLMEVLQWELQEYSNIYIIAVYLYLVDNQMFVGLKFRQDGFCFMYQFMYRIRVVLLLLGVYVWIMYSVMIK